MTRAQVAGRFPFCRKFEFSKKISSPIPDKVSALAISNQEFPSFIVGTRKLAQSKPKALKGAIPSAGVEIKISAKIVGKMWE